MNEINHIPIEIKLKKTWMPWSQSYTTILDYHPVTEKNGMVVYLRFKWEHTIKECEKE